MMIAREGFDRDARAAFVEKYRPFLSQLTGQYLGNKYQGRLSVSDIVQSAIVEAFNDFNSCRAQTEAEFKSWLRRLLINDIVNKIRFVKQDLRDVRRENPDAEPGDLPGKEPSPASKLVQAEEESRLIEAMSTLSDEDQQVIRLRSKEKLPFAEIGKQMERSEDAARMLWTRAIQRLAKVLNA